MPRTPVPRSTIKVVESGAEPRQVLRFEPQLHVPEEQEVTIQSRTTMMLGPDKHGIEGPPVHRMSRLEATGRLPGGDIEVREVIDGFATRRLRMSPSGQIVAVEGELPDGITQTPFGFPEQPIGIGASWKMTGVISAMGIPVELAAAYHLIDLEDNTATIGADLTMQASPAALAHQPAGPDRLTSANLHMTSVLTIPLHHLTRTVQASATAELAFSRGSNSTQVDIAQQPVVAAP